MSASKRGLLALFMAIMIAFTWLGPMDAPALEQVDAGLNRALVSFATARAINAGISFAQGTEVSAQPFGVGVNLTPGQLLDPVNDLVERFSDWMLAASVAFGVQKLLIGIGAYWVFSLVVTVAALAWTAMSLGRQRPPAWLSRIVVLLFLLRFAAPLITLGTELMFQQFLADEYRQSQQVIETTSGKLASLDPPPRIDPGNLGLVDRARGWLAESTDVSARFEALKKAAEEATEHIITLIVIFLLQTLLIPVALLWALYRLATGVFESPALDYEDK